MRHDETRTGSNPCDLHDLAKGNAFPRRVELGPARDAMDVGLHRLGGQRSELLPGQLCRLLDFTEDAKTPPGGIELRYLADVQHGKVARHVLAGRQTLFERRIDFHAGCPPAGIWSMSARTIAAGSSACVTQRSTEIPRAPAATASATLPGSKPPIAKKGRSELAAA